MKTLKDRVAVITGAGSGIGRATALALAHEGCHLALSDIDQDSLAETADLLGQVPVRVHTQVLDVSDRQAMQDYPNTVKAALGLVNLVINNAGTTIAATVEEHTIEDYEWLMGINFWGVVYGTKFFMPHLQEVDEAHIVNISSIFGCIGVRNQSAYNATKFAVRGFTESLKQELHRSHIGVSCVHPGGVKTKIIEKSRFKSVPGVHDHADLTQKFAAMAKTSSAQAAAVIVKGIRAKQERILIGSDARFLDILVRMMPSSYPKFLRRVEKLLLGAPS